MSDEVDDIIKRIAANNLKRTDDNLKNIKHAESVDTQLQTQQVIVQCFGELVGYLDQKVSKAEVVNQLTEIGTPDVEFVVKAMEPVS